jgi:hypothetical protein
MENARLIYNETLSGIAPEVRASADLSHIRFDSQHVKLYVKLSLYLFNQAVRPEDIRRRCVVMFTPLPLYAQGNRPRYALYRKLGGPQNRSGRYRKENNRLALPGI